MGELSAIHENISFGATEKETINILVLNVMPNKLETESQILNLSSGVNKKIDFTFLYPKSHHFKSDILDYLESEYVTLEQIEDQFFDALVVTGAPVECLPFEQVDYWEEFKQIIDWAEQHVQRSLFLCWSSQAALNYGYGIEKHEVQSKISGIFPHTATSADPLLSGLPKTFYLPHSRHTTLDERAILANDDLILLSSSAVTGPEIIISSDHRNTYLTGHPEYGTDTLANEYFRDQRAGLNPHIPDNYFPQNHPTELVKNYWHEYGVQIFANWLQVGLEG